MGSAGIRRTSWDFGRKDGIGLVLPASPSQPAGASASTSTPAPQFDNCTEDIKSKQLESRRWSGGANEIAARLGRYQKDLFEGRCAGHPEAQAYIAGANKMLANSRSTPATATSKMSAGDIRACDDKLEELRKSAMAGSNSEEVKRKTLGMMQANLFTMMCPNHPNAATRIAEAKDMMAGRAPSGGNSASAGSGSRLEPLKQNPKITEHNPVHDATACVRIYHGRAEIEAAGRRTTTSSLIVNTCNYAISITWCIAAGNGQAGDCKPGYSNMWDLAPDGSWGIGAEGRTVHYAACRHNRERGWGFQHVEVDPRHPFRYSCG